MLSTTAKYLAFGVLVLATCSGCLREPFHGKNYESRTDTILFYGVWPYPDEYVEVQVRNPGTGGWEFLDATTTDRTAVITDGPTGTWYSFESKVQIPFSYWEKESGEYACRIRTVTKNGAMLTFHSSLKETLELSLNGPIAELAEDHVHGQEATIYASN